MGDADSAAVCDRLDHATRMTLVAKRTSDRRLLQLLAQGRRAGVLDGGTLCPTDQGVPQGGVSSPLVANGVLHELDREGEDHGRHLGQRIRDAADVVIRCRTARAAQEAHQRVGELLAGLGVTLHPAQTRVVEVSDGRNGFDVLGGHGRKVESWRKRGRRYLQRWPSRRAMPAGRDRITAITAPRHRWPEPIQAIGDEVNRLRRGWGAYVRVGNAARQFRQVDDYVRERWVLVASKKAGRRGRGGERHALAV